MSDILSETKADNEVIKNLLIRVKWLQERFKMSVQGKILFDANGDVFLATEFSQLSEAQLNQHLEDAQEEAAKVQAAIDYSNKLQAGEQAAPAPVETAAPEVPAEAPAPEQPTEPTAPENVVPSIVPAPEAAPEAPAPQPAETVDPATAPAPVAPIVLP